MNTLAAWLRCDINAPIVTTSQRLAGIIYPGAKDAPIVAKGKGRKK